jgi:hypothetical protein
MNGPEQPNVTYSSIVPEGSILDGSVINRTPGNMRNANMMGSISSDVVSRDPNLVSGYIANENDIFKQFDLDDVVTSVNNGRVKDAMKVAENAVSQDIFNDVVIERDNQENSVKGIVEETALSNYFFSKMNTNIIHDTIRYNVYKNTGNVVSRQSENELFIIMRSILLQFGNFRSGYDELKNEIINLNKRVVDYCTEYVSSQASQHMQYVNELEKLPTPINFPSSTREFNYTYDISNLL